MIVSLPMYDRPETRAANDRLWAGIRSRLNGDLPEALDRNGDPWSHWQSPDLFLSQTCGLPFRTSLCGKVALVGAPIHDLPCPPGHYYSVIVARVGDPRGDVVEFAGARLAINAWSSQSGWAAIGNTAEALGVSFGEVITTGGHRASARAVAESRADLAAIDAVTWRMIRRWDGFSKKLKEIAETEPTPSLPYITSPGHDAATLFSAIEASIDALGPRDRDCLCLRGITLLPAAAYLAVPVPSAVA